MAVESTYVCLWISDLFLYQAASIHALISPCTKIMVNTRQVMANVRIKYASALIDESKLSIELQPRTVL